MHCRRNDSKNNLKTILRKNGIKKLSGNPKTENDSLPNLVIIDGGKGQLSSAVKSLDQLGLRGKITIIGIAKRLEEIYYRITSYNVCYTKLLR